MKATRLLALLLAGALMAPVLSGCSNGGGDRRRRYRREAQ